MITLKSLIKPQLFALLLILVGFDSINATAVDKPNVLFLFADDMRADTIAALGDKAAVTPNIDALVRRGFQFSNAYCMGGNSGAVCLPSRNMLLSGNAFFRWKDQKIGNSPKGMFAPADGVNFPETMKAAGYETYHHGKRGNTAVPIQARFDHNKYLKNDESERKSGEPGKEIADEAITFIQNRKQDQPFFMYLAFGNPHDPRVADKKYMDMIDTSMIKLPANFMPEHPFDNGELKVRDEMLAPHPRPVDVIKQQWHEYYAVQAGMDFHIGRVIEQLKSSGQLENTIVIFSADQGIALGSHGLLGKQNLYDHCMKSPLIFAGPGVSHGSSDALLYLFDIFPTVCEIVGAKDYEKIDGKSFKSVLDGRSGKHRDALMLAYKDVQRAIVTHDDKLITYPKVKITQLFHRKNDPNEMKNLFDDPDEFDKWKDLFRRLEILQDEFGDQLDLSPPSN